MWRAVKGCKEEYYCYNEECFSNICLVLITLADRIPKKKKLLSVVSTDIVCIMTIF